MTKWSLSQIRRHSSGPRRRLAASSLAHVAEPHHARCVLAMHPPVTTLGVALITKETTKLPTMSEIESVAIVGAGFMGTGIAEAVAVSGIPVIIRDVDDAALARAGERIDTSLARAVRGGKLQAAEAGAVRERIELTTQLEAIGEADLVIEAVPEDAQLKLRVMAGIAEVVSDDAIVASNTSSIPIAELAQAIRRPERMLGLHFFSPVPVMSLVEVVVALDTNERTVDSAKRFVERLGKRPIETKDRSGFIVNMLLVPYLMAAVRMYEEDFASREDIDNGMKLGCGHPMGPLTLCDFIGLDVLYAIGASLYDEFKRDEYAPPPLLKRMVASGRLGRKSGRGFYDYSS
jgi:3-hydroxybutyryl-CoA dehydrogenase